MTRANAAFAAARRLFPVHPTARPPQSWTPSRRFELDFPVTRVLRPPSTAARVRRAYHSAGHPSPPTSPFSDIEKKLLAAACAHVLQRGFSAEALALGARDAGYLDVSPNVLPDGVFSLIRWHLATAREQLAGLGRNVPGPEGAPYSQDALVRSNVETLTWERLRMNIPVVRWLQDAFAIMAQPSYIGSSMAELAMLADELWYLAGDLSVDPSWYTKRAALSTIYASSELFMTNDHSPDFKETRSFLRRRLRETDALDSATRSIGEWVGFTATAGINLLRSKGVRI